MKGNAAICGLFEHLYRRQWPTKTLQFVLAVLCEMQLLKSLTGALARQLLANRRFFALTRVTASTVEEEEPQESELWHMYCAMGLPGQHAWQQSLLARCYDFHGAACILRAIAAVFQIRGVSTSVTLRAINYDSLLASFALRIC